MTTTNAAAQPWVKPLTTLTLGILFVSLALAVLLQANPGTRIPGRDYGFYVYIGEQIAQGKLPYRDAWESKPPAIFYLNAVGLWIGRGSRWGVWALEMLSLGAAISISYVLMKKSWGLGPALAGLACWLAGLEITLQGGNLTEEYPLPLHFLSLLLFVKLSDDGRNRLYNVLLGAAFSISFLFRPNNAVLETAAILVLLGLQITRRDLQQALRQLAWILAGALPPLLLTGLFFWSHGLWRDLIEASLLYNLAYSSTQITAGSPLQRGFEVFGMLAWISLAGYLIGLARLAGRTPNPARPLYLLLTIGWPLVMILSDPARRSYDHYLINWVPFVGMLAAVAVQAALERVRSPIQETPRSGLIVIAGALTAALVFFVVGGRAAEYQRAFQRLLWPPDSGSEVRSRTAIYAENHTDPGDLVLFWAASPGENFSANRASPSGSLFYPLYVRSEISDRLSDRFLQEVMAARPILIIDIGDNEALALDPVQRSAQIAAGLAWEYPPENLDDFFAFVEHNYYLAAQVGDRTVYRLRPR